MVQLIFDWKFALNINKKKLKECFNRYKYNDIVKYKIFFLEIN